MHPARKMPDSRERHLRHLWDAPHKPLFLASFLAAFSTVAWWPLGAFIGVPDPAFASPVLWHIHELLFGFAAAAVAGYVLTALPGWTGQPPLRGTALQGLVLLWVLARIATALADALPLPVPVLANSGYFLMLTALVAHPILVAGAYGKLGFCLAIMLLGCVEVVVLVTALTGQPWLGLTLAHLTVIGFALLITGIATRAIPAFTRNWFALAGRSELQTADTPRGRHLAQGLLAIALMCWLAGWPAPAHAALIGAALVILWIMRRWRTAAALANPLLAALHLAFLWVPLGLGVIGLSWVFPATYPVADAIHAITIGGMSGLIMAIAGRAAALRDNGTLRASPGFVIAVAAIWVATWLRLSVPLFPYYVTEIVIGTALVWCAGWAVFIADFLPSVFRPVSRPVLSGKRHVAATPAFAQSERIL